MKLTRREWIAVAVVAFVVLTRSSRRASSQSAPRANLAPSVKAWSKPLLAQDSERVAPLAFLLAWLRVESQGNPCAVGKPTGEGGPLDADGFPWEVGIWQLDPGNRQSAGGFTAAELRPCCETQTGSRPEVEHCSRALTADEVATQVRSGLGYIRFCRGVVDAAMRATGTGWAFPDVDYLRSVKSVHGSPWVMKFGIPAFVKRKGRAPSTFDELADELLASPPPNSPGSMRVVFENARKTWP